MERTLSIPFMCECWYSYSHFFHCWKPFHGAYGIDSRPSFIFYHRPSILVRYSYTDYVDSNFANELRYHLLLAEWSLDLGDGSLIVSWMLWIQHNYQTGSAIDGTQQNNCFFPQLLRMVAIFLATRCLKASQENGTNHGLVQEFLHIFVRKST